MDEALKADEVDTTDKAGTEKTADAGKDKAAEAGADKATAEAGKETAAGEAAKGQETASDKGAVDDKEADKPGLPDDWREIAAAGDEDALKLLKRYGSLSGVVKALVEKDRLIRSGKIKRDMPEPSDEKAMAEWRKAEGIPDDATGYKLPEPVQKRMTDEDKPILSSFTEFAHKKGAKPEVVEIASEWYVDMMDTLAEKRTEEDKAAREAAEDALRKDWAHGEYKANITLAKRWASSIPGLGEDVMETRAPDGRLLGSIPEFISWAADMGRDKFGDEVFLTSDSEKRHTARKSEIETIMKTDIDRYYGEGLDKEYSTILEKETKRRK